MCNPLTALVKVISIFLQFQGIGSVVGEYPGSLYSILTVGLLGHR